MNNQVVFAGNGNHRMETGDHFKNGASSKSQMSRTNFLTNIINKKILLALFAAVLTAGYTQAQLTVGARAGVNYTNMLFLVSGAGSMSTQMQPGFQAGVIAERDDNNAQAGLLNNTQVGLLIVSQKCKFNEGSWMGFSNETLNMTYLRIPANFLYKKDLNDMKLLLHGGASLALAVAGKITGEERGEKVEEKIKFGEGGMSRFEMGFGLGAGLQFGNIQTVLEYNLGYNLGNSNGITMLNNGFALNVTYFFNK